jgi:hypothetical protein
MIRRVLALITTTQVRAEDRRSSILDLADRLTP